MKDVGNEIKRLTGEFADCQKLMIAIGDENRQHMIFEMMQMGKCKGVRVGEITERSHLSRPAVSHHFQILKDAGIIKVRHEGTMNYYFFDQNAEGFEKLILMLTHAKNILNELSQKSE